MLTTLSLLVLTGYGNHFDNFEETSAPIRNLPFTLVPFGTLTISNRLLFPNIPFSFGGFPDNDASNILTKALGLFL